MSEDAEIKGVIPNYYNLIIDKLNKIYDAWDNDNTIQALDRTLKLIPFLPRKLKKELKTDKDEIRNALKTAKESNGYNYQNAKETQWKNVKDVATAKFEPLIDKLTNLLDESHLLTQSYGIPTRARGMGDIQRTVDIARYEE